MNTQIIKSLFDRPMLGALQPDTMRWMRGMLDHDPFRQMEAVSGDEAIAFWPSVEVRESDKAYHFAVDLPGLKERDVSVSLAGNRLTVSGRREAVKMSETDTLYARERSYGAFARTFTLPVGIDVEHILASMEDGVLLVTLPKIMELSAKKIEVKAPSKSRSS